MIKRPSRGLFISFEGGDGSGKSTQLRILAERLQAMGIVVTHNQEPGATSIGKQVRRILLDRENSEMAPVTELLLMFASRAQAAAEIIVPALERDELVLTDRFTDSTLAYQGGARQLGFELVEQAHRLALGDLLPDLTLCVDLDINEGLKRAHGRNARTETGHNEARIDSQSVQFHSSVRDAYKVIAGRDPGRFRLVDGHGTPESVAARVWKEVEPALQRWQSRPSKK